MALISRFSASRGPNSVLAAALSSVQATFAQSLLHAQQFHTSGVASRGTKNLDWYVKAVRKIEYTKKQVVKPVFPVETLHGRKRARAFLDLKVGEDQTGAPATVSRVVIELADDVTPTTVANFLSLLSRPPGHGYIGSEAFKLQKGFALFFGDWLCSDGRGSVSSFAHSLVEGGEEAGRAAAPSSGPMKPGRAKGAAAVLAAPGGPLDVVGRFFPSENFIGRHSVPGVLGMASTGMHGSGSAFYITLAPAPHLDGSQVAFARVLTGLDTLLKVGSGHVGTGARPATPLRIVGGGQLKEGSAEWAAVDKGMEGGKGGKAQAAAAAAAPKAAKVAKAAA